MAPHTTRSESTQHSAFWLKRTPLSPSRGKGHGSDEASDSAANIPRNTAGNVEPHHAYIKNKAHSLENHTGQMTWDLHQINLF